MSTSCRPFLRCPQRRRAARWWLSGLSLVLLLGSLGSASAQPALPTGSPAGAGNGFYVTRSGTAMGTFVQIRVYVDEPAAANTSARDAQVGAIIEQAFAEIRRLQALLTTWDATSEVSRINAAAGEAAVPVSQETLEVIARSLVFSKLSHGAFDISFDALRGLWHFDEDLKPVLPSPSAIAARLPLINWQQIVIDSPRKTVRLGKKGMAINLGGIGKGFAVDAAVRILQAAGLHNGMVQAGGDLMLFGSKGGHPFLAGIRDPRSANPGDYFAVCPVIDRAFSTAGDYERAFIHPETKRRYHHILDPRTGYPARGARSVTVYAKDATTADGLDDAILILGPVRGLALIESIPDAGAVIVDGENRVHISRRLRGQVRIIHPPTPGL